MVTTFAVHFRTADPAPELVATERSKVGEVIVNSSVPDRVIATLVAFTWSTSVTEPDAMVRVVAGVVREIVAGAVYMSDAAWAEGMKVAIHSANTAHPKINCLFDLFSSKEGKGYITFSKSI
jgi:hypothetical protein